MTPTLIATVVILFLVVVFLRAERRELLAENDRLQRYARRRHRTAETIRNLRFEKRVAVDEVDALNGLMDVAREDVARTFCRMEEQVHELAVEREEYRKQLGLTK